MANITQLTVTELKKDPSTNSEFVFATSDTQRWGGVKKVTFLAAAGTYQIGDKVQANLASSVEDLDAG